MHRDRNRRRARFALSTGAPRQSVQTSRDGKGTGIAVFIDLAQVRLQSQAVLHRSGLPLPSDEDTSSKRPAGGSGSSAGTAAGSGSETER